MPQDFNRGKIFRPGLKFQGLHGKGIIGRPKEIRAKPYFNTMLLGQCHLIFHTGYYTCTLRLGFWCRPGKGQLFWGKKANGETGNEERIFLLKELHGLFIDQHAMIDTLNARLQGDGNGLWGVNMRHGIRPHLLSLHNNGPNLFRRELKPIQRIINRRHATARHDLNVGRTQPKHFPRCLLHFRHPIGNKTVPHVGLDIGNAHKIVVGFAQPANIKMASSLADWRTRRIDARPLNMTGINHFSQAIDRTTGITGRRKTTQEHFPGFRTRFSPQIHPVVIISHLKKIAMQR